MKNYYVHTKQLAVGYHGVPLISDIDISVKRGEILTLIGPNGGGKSTILKTFTRQLSMLGGTIYLGERDVKALSDAELSKQLSMVMTERVQPELMTCRDVVSTGRYPYTGTLGILSRSDRDKVWEAMELVHAAELANQSFSAVSDGQRQRIMLARAICQEPEIMILDEPTSYLDIKHKLELLSILKQLVRERQLAVIMSLHELDLAQKVSDTVVCVKACHIERVGAPADIFKKEYIEALYDVTSGSYDANFGSVELNAVKGKPEVFVIGGGGSGIAVYRELQRKGIPFAAGILQANDLDYPVAKTLGAEVISVPAFCSMTEESFQQAMTCMQSCDKVICCLSSFGELNEMNRRLYEAAEAAALV